MTDTTLLGQLAAECMGSLDDSDGSLTAVGILAVVSNHDGDTLLRCYFSERMMHHQLGLLHAALTVTEAGYEPDVGDDSGDSDDDTD